MTEIEWIFKCDLAYSCLTNRFGIFTCKVTSKNQNWKGSTESVKVVGRSFDSKYLFRLFKLSIESIPLTLMVYEITIRPR